MAPSAKQITVVRAEDIAARAVETVKARAFTAFSVRD